MTNLGKTDLPKDRQALLNEGCQKFKDIKIDAATRVLCVGDKSVRLTPTKFRIVEEMILSKNNLLHKTEFYKKIYGCLKYDDVHPLRVNISQINNQVLKGFNVRINRDERAFYSLVQKVS